MDALYLMVTVVGKNQYNPFLRFYEEHGLTAAFSMAGRGTATNDMLDCLGLEATEKAVILSVAAEACLKQLRLGLRKTMRINVPGNGIVFLVPLSSIGGKKPLLFLTENQNFRKGEESTLKDTKYELLMAVINQGYTRLLMDAARDAGASGGTILHAKGTGMERAEAFLGVSFVAEKEIVLIVVPKQNKNRIMKAIMDEAGAGSRAGAIVFSLPVTSVMGMELDSGDPEAEEA